MIAASLLTPVKVPAACKQYPGASLKLGNPCQELIIAREHRKATAEARVAEEKQESYIPPSAQGDRPGHHTTAFPARASYKVWHAILYSQLYLQGSPQA